MFCGGSLAEPPIKRSIHGMIPLFTPQDTMNTTKTFRFDATWMDNDGVIESEILTIQAANLKDATAAAVEEINGVNSFADCLIDLQRLR